MITSETCGETARPGARNNYLSPALRRFRVLGFSLVAATPPGDRVVAHVLKLVSAPRHTIVASGGKADVERRRQGSWPGEGGADAGFPLLFGAVFRFATGGVRPTIRI